MRVLGVHENGVRRLPGLEDCYTPASDHLLDVLNKWRDSFATVHADFEGVHDLWEVLFAPTYCEAANDEPTREGTQFWSPLGRIGWRHLSWERILRRIRSIDLRRQLIETGFAGGHEDRLTATVNDYAAFLADLSWR